MVTIDFVKLCMSTVLTSSTITLMLADSPTGSISKFGAITPLGNVAETATSVTWKSHTAQYFNEGDATPTTVSCINAGYNSGNAFTSYYSMPLQSSVSLAEGNQIKVNPYAEKDGVHTRGIMVKFSLPE